MSIDLPINSFVRVNRYLHIELCTQLLRELVMALNFRNSCTYFVFVKLGFIIGRLASAMSHNRPSLAKVLERDQLGCH